MATGQRRLRRFVGWDGIRDGVIGGRAKGPAAKDDLRLPATPETRKDCGTLGGSDEQTVNLLNENHKSVRLAGPSGAG